eukprot:3939319-Prymnesium_polylepis.1
MKRMRKRSASLTVPPWWTTRSSSRKAHTIYIGTAMGTAVAALRRVTRRNCDADIAYIHSGLGRYAYIRDAFAK